MAAKAWKRRRQNQQFLMAVRQVSRDPNRTARLTYEGVDYVVMGIEKYRRLTRLVETIERYAA